MAEYEQKKLARRELGVGGKPAAAAALPFPKVAEAEAAEAGAEEGDDGRVTLEKVLGGGEGVPESVKRIAECCASLRSPAAKLGGGAPASPPPSQLPCTYWRGACARAPTSLRFSRTPRRLAPREQG